MTSYDEFATKIIISLVAINCIVALIKAIHLWRKTKSRSKEVDGSDGYGTR